MSLLLSPLTGRTLTEPGDFQVAVTTDKLLLPEDLYGILRRQNIETPEEFVSYAHSFPTALATMLNWKVSEVKIAKDHLIRALQDKISEEILSPRNRQRRSYGALQPDWDEESED